MPSFAMPPPLTMPQLGAHTFSPPVDFQVASAPSLLAALPLPTMQLPSGGSHTSNVQLAGELTAELAHSNPVIKTILSAAGLGRALHETAKRIEADLKTGRNPTEAVVCRTLAAAVETKASAAGAAAIVGGIPTYVAEMVATPPLIFTAPVVAATLPSAFANMEQAAAMAGEATNATCRDLFAKARDLSRQGGNK